jgi:hypothetical protein
VLHPDLKTIPRQPEVQVIGNGLTLEYEDLKNAKLSFAPQEFYKQPRRRGRRSRLYQVLSMAHCRGTVRPQSALVSSLLTVQVPKGRYQKLRYDEGSTGDLDVSYGTHRLCLQI